MLNGCWKVIMARVARARGQGNCTVLYCTVIWINLWYMHGNERLWLGLCDISRPHYSSENIHRVSGLGSRVQRESMLS